MPVFDCVKVPDAVRNRSCGPIAGQPMDDLIHRHAGSVGRKVNHGRVWHRMPDDISLFTLAEVLFGVCPLDLLLAGPDGIDNATA